MALRRALLLGLVLLAGCGGEDAARPVPATSAPAETAPPEVEPPSVETVEIPGEGLAVYFLRGEQIGAGTRATPDTPAAGREAMTELLAGPTDAERAAGLATQIPQGTELLGLEIAGGLATVDLSGAFEDGGGSLSMRARVAQVVFTLTQFPSVERVAFRIDGRDVDAIGGEGVFVEEPPTRADFEDLAPAILVEHPGPGDEVSSPILARGTSNTFEATLWLDVVAPDGTTLAEQLVTATSGSGDRGTFEASVALETDAEEVTLVAYERSALDGSRTNVVEIPLQVAG